MQATLFSIEGRIDISHASYADAADFVRGKPETTSPQRVLKERGWSPYCIDATNRELIFVRLPATTNLVDAAFLRIAQLREANAVLTLPLSELAAVAAELADPSAILLFSMGRCGSTLVSHALNGSGSVASLSEPAVFDHRELRKLNAAGDVSLLIRDLIRLFASLGPTNRRKLAIKFRSQTLFIAELFWKALPDARYVFLYRDALSWGESFLQFLIDVGVKLPMDAAGRDFFWMMNSADKPLSDLARFMDPNERPIVIEKVIASGWVVHLEEYRRLLDVGLPFMALRYNELVARRDPELARLFSHCGIGPNGLAGAAAAFAEDSQKGTGIGRKADKRKFDDAGILAFRATLNANPELADPYLIVQGA